jgi:hypothetical protein
MKRYSEGRNGRSGTRRLRTWGVLRAAVQSLLALLNCKPPTAAPRIVAHPHADAAIDETAAVSARELHYSRLRATKIVITVPATITGTRTGFVSRPTTVAASRNRPIDRSPSAPPRGPRRLHLCGLCR